MRISWLTLGDSLLMAALTTSVYLRYLKIISSALISASVCSSPKALYVPIIWAIIPQLRLCQLIGSLTSIVSEPVRQILSCIQDGFVDSQQVSLGIYAFHYIY